MLTLTRRAGQTLLLGSEIEIRVVRVQGDRVVLSVDAPRALPIARGELLTAVRDETQVSALTQKHLLGLAGAGAGWWPVVGTSVGTAEQPRRSATGERAARPHETGAAARRLVEPGL